MLWRTAELPDDGLLGPIPGPGRQTGELATVDFRRQAGREHGGQRQKERANFRQAVFYIALPVNVLIHARQNPGFFNVVPNFRPASFQFHSRPEHGRIEA